MIEKIKDILNKVEEVSAWIIRQDLSKSTEIFLIKDQLDMNRSAQVEEYSVRVFVDFESQGQKFRGDALISLSASDLEEEIEEKIRSAVFAAGFVKNPWYDLPKPEPGDYLPIKEVENNKELKEKFADLHRVIYQAYPYQAQVNSCEIFAVDGYRRIVNSQGVDHAYPRNEFSFELVTDSDIGSTPVEIFNGYYLPQLDLGQVEKIVDKQLRETQGRAQAVPAKKMDQVKLILSSEAVESFFDFYLNQARDSNLYRQVSKVKLGQAFQGPQAREKVNIRMNPSLETSIYAQPLDEEGKKLSAYGIFEEGVAKDLITSAKFSHYLGVENRGNCLTFEVAGGENSLEDYKKGDYLEVLTFSDFQMDPITGDFGGEFRLARWVADGQETYLTAGAISDNIFRVQDQMLFSKERIARSRSLAPEAIILEDMTISGQE